MLWGRAAGLATSPSCEAAARAMTLIEALASALLLVCVLLVARRSIWNYAFGVAAVLLYAIVFLDARLYAALGLQGVFLLLNLYGLALWLRARGRAGVSAVPVAHAGRAPVILSVLAAVVGALALGFLLAGSTDAASPWWDAANSMAAIAAQWWQARRRVQTWAFWIAANIGSAGLYATQGLWFAAATYAILLGVAVAGWRAWSAAAANRRLVA